VVRIGPSRDPYQELLAEIRPRERAAADRRRQAIRAAAAAGLTAARSPPDSTSPPGRVQQILNG
jgi:hypothetical protein